MAKHVFYARVSTVRQGISGLGLDAQRASVVKYVESTAGEIISEFVEVESGKCNTRPVLLEALQLCKLTGATLTVAKLDRLSRDAAFITALQSAGTRFVAADLPEANEMMIGMLAVLAQYERTLISARTKAALQQAKERGPKYCDTRKRMTYPLGATATKNLTKEGAARGRANAVVVSLKKANTFAKDVLPIINHYKEKGGNLSSIANSLNDAGILTPRKSRNGWTAQAVKNVINRAS